MAISRQREHGRIIPCRVRAALFAFLDQRTCSLAHIALKLRIAYDVEDYWTDAQTLICRDIAPRAVVGALKDLESLE